MIAILDYGIGNLGSIFNIIRKAGGNAVISSSVDELKQASAIILPGVGSFDNAIKKLEQFCFVDLLNQLILVEKKPVLGICLGMQLLFETSEEGEKKGLGWISGKVKKFKFSDYQGVELKIPHMGWNEITYDADSYFSKTQYRKERYYFVHSYHAVCDNQKDVLATCHYGYDFTCAVWRENIYGAQFHPEKSHSFGIHFIKRFLEIIKC